jgi:xanthine/uracil permease
MKIIDKSKPYTTALNILLVALLSIGGLAIGFLLVELARVFPPAIIGYVIFIAFLFLINKAVKNESWPE